MSSPDFEQEALANAIHDHDVIREAANLFVTALDNPIVRASLVAEIGLAVLRSIKPDTVEPKKPATGKMGGFALDLRHHWVEQ